MARLPIEAWLVETRRPFAYQRIAKQAFRLQQLGLPTSRIARNLGVTDKTAAKAVTWYRQ